MFYYADITFLACGAWSSHAIKCSEGLSAGDFELNTRNVVLTRV